MVGRIAGALCAAALYTAIQGVAAAASAQEGAAIPGAAIDAILAEYGVPRLDRGSAP